MTFLTELQQESVMLHEELEKLTELSQTFTGPMVDLIAFKKMYIKERIEYNLNLQADYWLAPALPPSDIVRLYFENPGITQAELARRCGTNHTVVSRTLTNSFKKHSYEQNGVRA